MNQQIKIKNEVDCSIIDIEGTIGVEESWQFENPESRVATYERFRECVARIADIRNSEIRVNIRSTGGDVNDAILIYEALRATGAKVTTCCYGYTASAATIVAQAASEGCRYMASSSLYLIHQSSCSVEGNMSDLKEHVELLEKTDERIASLYAQRSAREKSFFEELMSENGGRGRWLSPEEVVEAALADEIIGVEERNKRGVVDMVKAWFGQTKQQSLPSDINILHTLAEQRYAASVVAFDEGQRAVQPSRTKSVEDPTIGELRPSRNATAYAEDAKRISDLLA
jgi:ATP-dependent protease ClpP protease subunit